MNYSPKKIELAKVEPPYIPAPGIIPNIPCEEYKERLYKLQKRVAERGLDALVIYSDREHFFNFNYLVGFDPRFEEALLVVPKDGVCSVLLGNECLPLCKLSKIEANPVLCQQVSLPNQPFDHSRNMASVLKEAGIKNDMNVGIVGWKLFDKTAETYKQFCAPAFVVDAVKVIVGEDNIENATDIFTSPEDGLRITNSAHAIAYYEYGATVSSISVQNIIDSKLVGLKETEIAENHKYEALPLSCHPILSVGENTKKGLVSPTSTIAKYGDPIAVCFGMRGGLSVRNGYIADNASDLGEAAGFLEDLAIPYITAVIAWYETVGIGVVGGDLYNVINSVFPKEKYGWFLNPGHLISDEEWMSSPVYPNSQNVLKSGMLMQMDIIPSVEGYVSINSEDGICIADEQLQQQIRELYPEVYNRMMERRRYMIEELGIQLKPEILPMSNIAGYYRPYFLNKDLAFRVVK